MCERVVKEGLCGTGAPDWMVDGGGRRLPVMGLRSDRVIN